MVPLIEILQLGIAVVVSFIVYFKYVDKKLDKMLDKLFPSQTIVNNVDCFEDDLEEL